MSKSGFKTLLYTVITIGIIVLCVSLFFTILPYLLVGGLVIWAIIKLNGTLNRKKQHKDEEYSSSSYTENEEVRVEEILEDVVDVIDVDYKEAD